MRASNRKPASPPAFAMWDICRSPPMTSACTKCAGSPRSCAVSGSIATRSRSKEAQEMFPIGDLSDVRGAFYIPEDGRANPVDVTMSLAKGARMGGARIFEGIRVTEILARNGTATGRAHRRRPDDHRRKRGHLRRDVVAPAGREGRDQPAPAGGRTLLPDHRNHPRPAPRPAGARRPVNLYLLPRRGGRDDAGPVRAGRRGLETRRRSPTISSSAKSNRIGTAWARIWNGPIRACPRR